MPNVRERLQLHPTYTTNAANPFYDPPVRVHSPMSPPSAHSNAQKERAHDLAGVERQHNGNEQR